MLLELIPWTVSQQTAVLLADKAEAAVKGGVADVQKSLIGRRIVPRQSGILVLETDNHAHIAPGLSTEQSPGAEGDNFSAEFLQHRAGLRTVAIASLLVPDGCFNDDIRAHISVPSVCGRTAVTPNPFASNPGTTLAGLELSGQGSCVGKTHSIRSALSSEWGSCERWRRRLHTRTMTSTIDIVFQCHTQATFRAKLGDEFSFSAILAENNRLRQLREGTGA